jgi:cell surface protein SprA
MVLQAARPVRAHLAYGQMSFPQQAKSDTNDPDTTLPYPFQQGQTGGVYGSGPGNVSEVVRFNPETGLYEVVTQIGSLEPKPPMVMTPEEYQDYVARKQANDYWKSKAQQNTGDQGDKDQDSDGLIPQITVDKEFFRRIFGSSTIDIRPQGYAELRFGGRLQKIDNPIIPERNRSTFTFDFDQRIQMNVTGNVGDKMKINFNYDTEATFNFENQVKLEYTGKEDEIIKKLELGNVNLPVNSSLITGAQSLFGVKGQFQFGKLTLTSVVSEQQSQTQSVNVQGGATTTEFEIWGDEYEANKHFFLSHYFRDNYEDFLENAPLITSPVQITKIEVWVTNTNQNTQDTRNLIAFMDLGENRGRAYRQDSLPGPDIFDNTATNGNLPDNLVNDLAPRTLENNYPGVRQVGQANAALNAAGFEEATDYIDLANARKLRPSEYDYNPQLGYVSLNSPLNQDEVLAVAFQYTANGRVFQVGEFSTDGVSPPQNLVVKMLKSTILDVSLPMWDLMMKNIYSLSAFQVSANDFRMQVMYRNDETGTPVPFLPETNLRDELLLRVMELDKVNNNNDPTPDGFFDFIPGVTIRPQNGRIIFPVLEPFGGNLRDKLNTKEMREQYVFSELYDSTRFVAQNQTNLNKYLIKGQFKSNSSSEIKLNAFNIPRGSVSVTAGGTQLTEGQDYTVDYNLGRVKILNEGILNSGIPIKVNYENNALFNFQTKTFAGLNADYRVNDNLNLGASVVHLNEKPLTQKVNLGDEPIANTMIGVNGNYDKEAPFLTRFVDAIPFIDTKAKSNINIQGEVARMLPGSPRGIEIGDEPTTYLDDFESSQTTIDIRNPMPWRLASVPGGQPNLFPETDLNSIASGFNRARLAWYTIDPLFHNNTSRTPDNITDNPRLQSTNDVRLVLIEEVFPNLDLDQSSPLNLATLDLAYYPSERGPYNLDVAPTGVSAGINTEGELESPGTRWAGIMRGINSTNFEQQNIEFVQFWMLNPFVGNDDPPDGGDFYINLGSISEDILKDGQQAVENGIPTDGTQQGLDSTRWGFATNVRPPVVAFGNDPNARDLQDVGYDLIDDEQEENWAGDPQYSNYLQRIANSLGQASQAYQQALEDPFADNFQYYRGDDLDQAGADILDRYRYYNNPEGNSDPTAVGGVTAFATNLPDIEDLNQDQTLSKTESYYQYKVSLRPEDLDEVGKNYITNITRTTSPEQPDGNQYQAEWIQFKVPVFNPDKTVGNIGDFRSIRFIRLFLKNFSQPVVLRFARMEFVRSEWRRYRFSLDGTRERLSQDDQENTLFEVNAVNIEQNGSRNPIPYVVPPGIDRQVLFGTTSANQQNEQALSLRILGLEDGDARAVFRNLDFDMRLYKRMKLFTHLESAAETDNLQDGDLTVFIRLGADYNLNYYEYEIPMEVTPWGSSDPNDVWPQANRFDFPLDILKEVKLERNRVYNQTGAPISDPFTRPRLNGNVTVVGQPNLGNVRTVLIGVRNPKKRLAGDGDDGLTKSAEVWINELRLTEFDQKGGWAANARVAATLADFANVSVSGRASTVGFGSLDQNVSEFQQEEVRAYNLQSSFQLGKFFSQESGLRIPMFFGRSEEWITPRFNPLDPDIEFDRALNNIENPNDQDSLQEAAQNYTRRRSLNFTNVRKTRSGKGQNNPMPWDVENISLTYSFNEVFRRNINTVFDRSVQHSGNINYTYRTKPLSVEPFKNIKWLQAQELAFIRDFNFYFYPKSFSAILKANRSYTSMQMRNTDALLSDIPSNLIGELEPTYNKNFTLNRDYNMLFDLSKSLRFDYNARMQSRVDELAGPPNSDSNRTEVMDNLRNLGRPINYHQTMNLTWEVPLSKFPLLDFATASATYTADYDWRAPSQTTRQRQGNTGGGNPGNPGGNNNQFNVNFGNTIQNNRQIRINSNFNFRSLYNKVPYLKEVLSQDQNKGGGQRRRNNFLDRPGANLSAQNRKPQTEEDTTDEEPSIFEKILAQTARVGMLLKSASGTYSRSQGQILPGFRHNPQLVGLSAPTNNYAPGFGFTAGSQRDIRELAVRNDWLVLNEDLNNQYNRTFTENMNFRVTAEPLKDFRIILTAQQNSSSNLSEFFRFNDSILQPDGTYDRGFESQNTFQQRSFSTSFFTLNTAFSSVENPDFESPLYEQFLENRLTVSRRLANRLERTGQSGDLAVTGYEAELTGSPDSSNYGYRYYSVASQPVLITSFLAAYSGNSVENYDLGVESRTPLPNWQINYDGLNKLDFIKKWTQSIVLKHTYRSTYSANNITTNLLRQKELQDFPLQVPLDNNGDLLQPNQISVITISEQFSPLIGFDAKLKNKTTFRLEYKRDRNIALNLTNQQRTETYGQEWVIGAGYIIPDVKLKFVKLGKRKTSPQSNLELRADVSLRNNVTIIRKILEDVVQPTGGQRTTSVKLSADYQISSRVQAKLFYNLNATEFQTSQAYPLTTNQFGISVRLNLGR